ncbi:MAG: XrtN system VIT domain-containing protein [Bacteroidota bacterium]
MKRIISFLSDDPLYLSGIILILVSSGVLALDLSVSHQNNSAAFMINYLISIGYTVAVLVRAFSLHGWRIAQSKLSYTGLLLILWFTSAFALNLEMNVFDDSVTWLTVWIILASIVFIFATQWADLPAKWNNLVFFLLGAALLLFIYYAIYILPLYVLSAVALVALGISMHTFIPLFLSLVSIVLVIRAVRQNKALLYPVICGLAWPVILGACFLLSWGSQNAKINYLVNQNTLEEGKLPAWIYVSQHLEPSFLTERILKSGLVYQEANLSGNLFWGDMPSRSFDERKQHDPLVVMATLFFERPALDEKDRIHILKAMYQSRHQAQERLWSGDFLETKSVISNVKLFPAYRIAYTEKILSIRNIAPMSWSQQEAVYTFHLSEGAVVSSLSLWIEGVEEKSRLTTKSKADSAYKQVVGVESRDPSVVHWQEGNTITVRVFPCTTEEDRRFKIGITSPLAKKGDRLLYQNVFFDGPSATGAAETLQLSTEGPAPDLQMPSAFEQSGKGVYRAERSYSPDLELSCKAPVLTRSGFSFGGAAYQSEDYTEKYKAFDPQQVYLDLNGSWSATEFESLFQLLSSKKVYVYDGELVRLSAKNKTELFQRLSRQSFSLFPIQEIHHPESALLISKSSAEAPNLSDLEGSAFGKELTSYMKSPKQIAFYNLGTDLSPYLNALKELRVLNYSSGNMVRLNNLLKTKRFIENQEDDRTVVIETAGLLIRKVDSLQQVDSPPQVGKAPDHLLRLFAYNDIMKKVGPNFFSKNYVQPDLIAEAEQGYIVSPVSSMIVLETQKDYERFDIEENKNSLKNASMKSSGAVPEPEEWVLMILCLSVAGYVWYSRRYKLVSVK